MKNEALERPQIKDYCSDASLSDMHSTYVSNQGIWKYLQALDAYCDQLEKLQCDGNPDSDTSGGLHLAGVSNNEVAVCPFCNEKTVGVKLVENNICYTCLKDWAK